MNEIEIAKLKRKVKQLERALRNVEAEKLRLASENEQLSVENTDLRNLLSTQSSILSDAQAELKYFQEQAS